MAKKNGPTVGFIFLIGLILIFCGSSFAADTTISGTFSDAYIGNFTTIYCDPEVTPVVFSGWVEATGLESGAVGFGLIDKGYYDTAPGSKWFSGAYLYLGRIGSNNIRVGPSDGFYDSELNQTGANVPYVSGGPNKIDFTMTIFNGQITVNYGSTDYVDTYSEIEAANILDAYPWAEFENGAYVSISNWPDTNSVDYDITISGCSVEQVYKNLGQCISSETKLNCSDFVGLDLKDCIDEQIGYCHGRFGVPSNHVELPDGL